MTAQPEIWVWAEQIDGALSNAVPELVGEARELADRLGARVCAILLGHNVGTLVDRLAAVGADRVLLFDAPDLRGYASEVYTAAIADLAASGVQPLAVLIAQSANGADLAPRLAAALGVAFLSDCIWMRPDEGGLCVTRAVYDERVYEEWHVPDGAAVVSSFHTGIRGEPETHPGRTAEVVQCRVPEVRAAARRVRVIPPDPRTVALRDADRIVAAGLGIGDRAFLDQVQELADALGAALGASRPLADRGWVPFERQIGTTGQMVSPRLYVALGISGAIQHLAGVVGADTIVTVNVDRTAPMMAMATLGVVGDVHAVVPRLLDRLRQRGVGSAPPAESKKGAAR